MKEEIPARDSEDDPVLAALRSASAEAHRQAAIHGTKVAIFENGQVVLIEPQVEHAPWLRGRNGDELED